MIKNGIFARFAKEYKDTHSWEWQQFKAAHKLGKRLGTSSGAGAAGGGATDPGGSIEDAADDSTPTAAPLPSAHAVDASRKKPSAGAASGATSTKHLKMPRGLAAARAAVMTTRDHELLQVCFSCAMRYLSVERPHRTPSPLPLASAHDRGRDRL